MLVGEYLGFSVSLFARRELRPSPFLPLTLTQVLCSSRWIYFWYLTLSSRYVRTHQVQAIWEKGLQASQALRLGHTVGSTFQIPARQDYEVSLAYWIHRTQFYAFILYIGKTITPPYHS